MSGAVSKTSLSLSLDFLNSCWPMSVWDAGTPLEGDLDLDLASLDVNTECRRQLEEQWEGKERVNLGAPRREWVQGTAMAGDEGFV